MPRAAFIAGSPDKGIVGGSQYVLPRLLPGLIWLGDPLRGITLTGGAISAWADAGGSGIAPSQSTASQRPTIDSGVMFGGAPTIKFDGAANSNAGSQLIATSGGVTGNGAFTEHLVCRWDAVGVFNQAIAMGTTGVATAAIGTSNTYTHSYWYGGTGDTTMYLQWDPALDPVTNFPGSALIADTTTFHLLTKTFDGTTVSAYIDGFFVGSYAHTYSLPSPCPLGFLPHASGFMASFHVALAAICSGAHSVATIRQLGAYCRARFGSSLGYAFTSKTIDVCLGDSLTHGTGAMAGSTDYPSQLAASANETVMNLGVPGQTVVTALGNVVSDVVWHTSGLCKHKLLIWYCTNDLIGGASASTATGNLLTYVAAAQAQAPAGTPAYVATLTHCSPTYMGTTPSVFNPAVDALNILIRSNAAAHGYTVVDLMNAGVADFAVDASLSSDGIHGTGPWYAQVAAAFQAAGA